MANNKQSVVKLKHTETGADVFKLMTYDLAMHWNVEIIFNGTHDECSDYLKSNNIYVENKTKLHKTDDRIRFYALYLYSVMGNRVLTTSTLNDLWRNGEWQPIKLKHTLDITKEDIDSIKTFLFNILGELAKDGDYAQNIFHFIKEFLDTDNIGMIPANVTDKMRLMGYAMDWNGYKISDQIELGWIEIINAGHVDK